MEGEGYFEFVYDGEMKTIPDGDYRINKLNSSHLDIVKQNYKLVDEENYIIDRLGKGVVSGIFDLNGTLMGFVGEHYEGAMGMLEILPEYRNRGLGTILECYKINETLTSGRTPYCNVFYDNEKSVHLQNKLGLKKTSLDTWWVWNKSKDSL